MAMIHPLESGTDTSRKHGLKIVTLLTLTLFTISKPLSPQPVRSNSSEHGRSLFQKHCANCHGTNAKGGRGPNLTTGYWKYGWSLPELVKNIREGIVGTQMPASNISIADAKAVVDFLHSIQDDVSEKSATG